MRADIDMMIGRSDDFDMFLRNMRRLGYRIREGKYITYCPPGFQKGRRDKSLGEGYSREDISYRICHREMEKDREPSVIRPETFSGMEARLAPYLKVRLSPYQLIFVKRIRDIGHYLDSRNPFAVKWKDVRKDAMEAGRLFEECMYLLEKDIRDPETLETFYRDSGRKERNLIRRIMARRDGETIVTREVSRDPQGVTG